MPATVVCCTVTLSYPSDTRTVYLHLQLLSGQRLTMCDEYHGQALSEHQELWDVPTALRVTSSRNKQAATTYNIAGLQSMHIQQKALQCFDIYVHMVLKTRQSSTANSSETCLLNKWFLTISGLIKLSWPWSSNFWPQNVLSASLSPTIRKLWILLNSLEQFVRYCVHKLLVYDHTKTHTHRDGQHDNRLPSVANCQWWHKDNGQVFKSDGQNFRL